ncbi:hypothetical protein [Cohnella massiliensis]|nr:hypothetical protein [Cohnella massiliensis]
MGGIDEIEADRKTLDKQGGLRFSSSFLPPFPVKKGVFELEAHSR